jgi:hypothetical protein
MLSAILPQSGLATLVAWESPISEAGWQSPLFYACGPACPLRNPYRASQPANGMSTHSVPSLMDAGLTRPP